MPTFIDPKFVPHVHADYIKEMIDQGKDPKDRLIEDCKPKCGYWKDKLTRCEIKLEKIIKINPTKSCLYPMRDWVTCVEACVQPAIHHALRKSG